MAVAPLDKCTVTGPILKPDGTPCYPAAVKITLSARDRDADITIMPAPLVANTDVDGNISVDLWPNVSGLAGTYYLVSVSQAEGKAQTSYRAFNIVVPDAATANLATISELVPPPSKNDALAALALILQAISDATTTFEGIADEVEQDAAAAAASAASIAGVANLLTSRVVGPVPITGSGTAITNTSVYFWPGSLSAVDEYVDTLEVGFGLTAGTVRIVFSKLETDGTLSAIPGVGPIDLPVVAGPNSVNSGLSILKPAGSVMGLQRTGIGTFYYTPTAIPGGEVEWFTAAIPVSHTAKSIGTSNGPQWKATFTGEISAKARTAFAQTGALQDEIDDIDAAIGGTQRLGWADPIVATGSLTPANYSIVLRSAPMPDTGFITELDIGGGGAATLQVKILEMSGNTVTNVAYATTVDIGNVANVVPVNIPVVAGQYLSIGGANIRFQNSVNPEGIGIWIKSPVTTPIVAGDVLTQSTQHRFEWAFKFKSGLRADVDRALAGGVQNTGLNVLKDADNTGATNSDAAFAAAALAHPFPYLTPGTPKVAVLPRTGQGLNGPGKLSVGATRFFTPMKPELINLFDGARASLAEHIANNDVPGLISDSRGHWAFAPTGPKHWWNLLTSFLNYGIAADEPLMTALRASSTYFPSFYGVAYTFGGVVLPDSTAYASGQNYTASPPSVVLSGANTYVCITPHTSSGAIDLSKFALVASTGSRGPLGESLILADGAGISFAGAYEQVDVHYTQDVAAGSLAFAFNGAAAYKTVAAAGALSLDKYSGPSLTGQAASGTYTIKAVGGPVEVTSLIRLGVKAAGSRPRLRTARFAHGSYTLASFTTARLTSAVVQAQAFGGKLVPFIDLGINDSFGTAPSVIAANLSAMLDTLEAAGCDRIFLLPPQRPSSAWDGSYTGGRTFDPALGAILGVCRGRNLQVMLVMTSYDHVNTNTFQDGLHLNEAGNDLQAQRTIQSLAAGIERNDKAAFAAAAQAEALYVQFNGRMTATKLVEHSGSGNSSFWQPRTGLVIGDDVELEVFAKKAERKRINFISNSGARYEITADLNLGTAAILTTYPTPQPATCDISAVGNGWLRFLIKQKVDVAGGMNPQHRIFADTGGATYVGDGVSGLFVQSSTFRVNGGPNLNVSPTNLSLAPWTRGAGPALPLANAGLFIGIAADPTNIGGTKYDDGSSILFGKKWAALGSSITIGAYYATLLAGQTNLLLTNLGVSGSALGLSTTAYASYGMSARIADIPLDTDLVTLEPGPNAFGAQETPLGVFGDQTYATHYGSLWKAILDMRARVPNAKIVVFGTYSGGAGHATHRIGRVNGQGNTMDQFMKAEREVCQALSVPYIDVTQSSVGYAMADLYTVDQLHPNAAGSLRYATYGAENLRSKARHGLFVN